VRAAIYNPYLDTLGGGERYSLSFARVLAAKGFSVDVQWEEATIKGKLENRFGMQLNEINIVPDVKRGGGYDVCFWVSDGSIPTLGARKNFLHFQFPFKGVKGRSLLNRMKLFRINKIIVNSAFTKGFVDEEYGVDSTVIYPPVDVEKIPSGKKENLILFVGRFSQLEQAKNQHVLVGAFKKFYDAGAHDWELTLAGGVEVGVDVYFNRLQRLSEGYPIKIVKSPDFRQLRQLYARAKLFWSAVGFGVNAAKEPKRVEHFGMTVVEAMAAGAIPIVFDEGGHKEIVEQGKNGFLWKSLGQLLKFSKNVTRDKALARDLSLGAKRDADRFSYDKFEKSILEIL